MTFKLERPSASPKLTSVLPPSQILHSCCHLFTQRAAVHISVQFHWKALVDVPPSLPPQSTVGLNNLWMRAIIYLITVDFFRKCYKGLDSTTVSIFVAILIDFYKYLPGARYLICPKIKSMFPTNQNRLLLYCNVERLEVSAFVCLSSKCCPCPH